MNQLLEDISWLYCRQHVYEMANMQPHETNLTATIHVMSKGGS